jgi:branched-chain amino acid transport system ATP-binding protein
LSDDAGADPVLLAVEGLSVSYGRTRAVQGIDLTVRAGEIVALLGANGAGKSSTLLAISGIVACSGRIAVDGVDLAGRRPEQIVARGVVQVPEARAIFPGLTVDENLAIAGRLRRRDPDLAVDRAFVEEVFPKLVDLRRRRAGALSGGEQQMLAIAKALLARPRLLLVDELSLGLAPKVTSMLFEALEQVHRRGAAILLVEQFVSLALRLAERVYVLEKGRVATSGGSAELRADRERLAGTYLGSHLAPPAADRQSLSTHSP